MPWLYVSLVNATPRACMYVYVYACIVALQYDFHGGTCTYGCSAVQITMHVWFGSLPWTSRTALSNNNHRYTQRESGLGTKKKQNKVLYLRPICRRFFLLPISSTERILARSCWRHAVAVSGFPPLPSPYPMSRDLAQFQRNVARWRAGCQEVCSVCPETVPIGDRSTYKSRGISRAQLLPCVLLLVSTRAKSRSVTLSSRLFP